MGRHNWLWFLAGGLGLAVLVAYLFQRFPGAVNSGNAPNLVYALVLLGALGGSAVLHFRARPGTALRQTTVWIAIGLVLVIGYSYRDEVGALKSRVTGELLPAQGQIVGQDGVAFRARGDGHFHVEAMVNGERVLFLVDTGASDVVLTPDDAARLGFEPQSLSYSEAYRTANGIGYGAPIRLDTIEVGPIRLTDVAASVNQAPMDRSLLGMTFLRRLSAYEVRGDSLTLWR
jgi:aspartyl protease family protein